MTLKEVVEHKETQLLFHPDEVTPYDKVLLETCQLFLNSPRLGENRSLPDANNYNDYGEFYVDKIASENWNACNEVNRIARVKWLQEKFENLPDIIFDCLDCDCVDAQLQNGDVAEASEYIAKAIRQHFERGEL